MNIKLHILLIIARKMRSFAEFCEEDRYTLFKKSYYETKALEKMRFGT